MPKNKQQSARMRVEDLTKRWLDHVRGQVKLSTYRKYEGLCNNHILPELGQVPLSRVTRAEVERFAEQQKNSGRTHGGELSAKTINDILVILGLAFEFAEEEYAIAMPSISFLREEKKEARVLSMSEQGRLIAHLSTHMDIYAFGTLLALCTGIRIGELCALLWEDVTEHYIVINKTLQRLKGKNGRTEIVVGSPKSPSSKRVVPLPEFLLPYVRQFHKDHGYVISTARCSRSEPRMVQDRFKKITAACGLEQVTFHTLRHTFATRCVEAGFDIKTLSEILGHSDIKTTLSRYVHSSFELKKSNMAKLSGFIHL